MSRDLGSAGSGVHHWWVQRLTAVALVPLGVWLLVSLLTLPSLDFVTLVSWIGGTWTASLLTLFVLTASWHSRLGVQVVLEDYVHDEIAKFVLIMANTFFAIAIALTSIYGILKLSFGL